MRKVSREEDGGVVYSSINVKCFVTLSFSALTLSNILKKKIPYEEKGYSGDKRRAFRVKRGIYAVIFPSHKGICG